MISYTTPEDRKVLGFHVSGKLSAEDYEEVLMPAIEAQIKANGKARILVEWSDNFKGWEAKAMLDDAKLCFAHWNDFEKIALVGAPKWLDIFLKMFDAVSKGDVKAFEEGRYDQAMTWAEA
ncbi:MAG: universal stress protein UspA [Robiginitomaculum sp.]|nr:MAG: universal stress protein UspA [Robiginitomaculum sp.]